MSYQSEVLADAPLAYWRLGESSGVTAQDGSGNGRTLTAASQPGWGAASLVPSTTDTAATVTSGAQALKRSLSEAWTIQPSYTVEAWVKTTASASGIIASVDNVEGGPGDDRRRFLYGLGGSEYGTAVGVPILRVYKLGVTIQIAGPSALNDGQPHHVVARVDDATKTIALAVDGVVVVSQTYTGTLSGAVHNLNGNPFTVGSALVGTANNPFTPFNGQMDEVAFYGTALSDARIGAHYDAALTGSGAGSGAGSFAWVGSASGVTPEGSGAGTATGTFGWSGAASGATVRSGSASGSLIWAGEAHGLDSAARQGSAVGAFQWGGVASGSNGATSLAPWTLDESRKTRAVAVTSGVLDFTPRLEMPPAGVVERVIMRESVTMPALADIVGVVSDPETGQIRVPDDVYASLPRVSEEVGVPRVVFPNVGSINDRTYWRGGQIELLRDRREEPFGDVDLTLRLPQVTSMDDDADSDTNDSPLNWTRNRANVEIVMRKSDGTIRRGLWTGHVVTHDGGNDERSSAKTLTCHGSMWQAASTLHRAPNLLDPTDIGALIPKALNEVVSRRYPKVPNVTTGVMSRQRGAWSDSQMAYAQDILATAWTAGGRQWTIAKVEGSRRTYEMRLKADTPSWTVTNGAPGVTVQLTKDATTVRNVVFGHGVGPDGYAWWNYHYPNLRQDDAPAYPYSSAGTVMSVGSTDAGTVSGEGVSEWQARARDLGYNVTVSGVFASDDATAAGAIQRRYGLQVDGIVGPQTWAATFDVGGNGGDLSGAIRLPLAADGRTQRYIYNADGSVAGENPEYDVNVIAYEADVDFGAGVTREEGIAAAQQIVDRESEPALVGRIVLKTDPREGSRLFIPPGDKLTLIGYEGADRVLHITAVERDWQNLTVTLEVDERARDAMTVQEIRGRNKAARKDPARRPGNVNRRSRLEVDQVVPFDGESGAGWIPKHALYGGLWTVIRVPVSELGRVAKIDLQTTGPAAKFAVALFGAPITPAHLVKYVGNPLASDSPYETNAELLEDRFGFIEGWGQSGQAAGYWPSSEGESALTGRLVDSGGFEYVSSRPPWVWVAEYAATPTFISGRVLPAPIQ